MIHLKDINKTYHNGAPLHVLKGINLDIEKGEFVSIMGASGSGKSTLLNILGILDNYDSGEYYLNDVLIRNLSETKAAEYRDRMIGFIFQSFNLIPTLSVVENVALPLTYRGIPTAKRLERSLSALEAVGLSGRLSHKPYELSGGQQQRVAIARAIAADPDLILADEPCGNLDSRSGKEVMELLLSRHKCGKTVILITHSLSDAKYADRILTVCDGKLYK